ncbi:PorT family protein [Rhodocaloribacter litoris]|uniref:porin family protein n=1 Tax=Rhodocaloribacter litoris TaxID=2558931 RepID=UPI00142475B2|nr:porin family protein [Rhodocaloribacter litoris]QXD13958.1 PorT family protein [Rhodocaloribacter litoris]
MLTLLLSAGAVTSRAQVPPAQPALEPAHTLTYGFRLGALYNGFTGDAVHEDNEAMGFSGGAYLNYRFSRHFALQPEVVFAVRQGQVTHHGIVFPAERVDYTFGMLDVPVLLKFYPFTGRTAQPALFAGPVASYHLYRDLDLPERQTPYFDADDQYRAGILGLTFGASLENRLFGRSVLFDTRYVRSLTNLFRDELRPGFRLEGWSVSVGVGF